MRATLFKTWHCFFVHLDEACLGRDVLEWFIFKEEGLDKLEEAFGVKLQKPLEKLRSRDETDDIKHVHSPLKGAESALRELLSLHK